MHPYLTKENFLLKNTLKKMGSVLIFLMLSTTGVLADVTISEFMAMNSYIPYTNPLDIKTTVYGQDACPGRDAKFIFSAMQWRMFQRLIRERM